jgi:general secretion pathway protein G
MSKGRQAELYRIDLEGKMIIRVPFIRTLKTRSQYQAGYTIIEVLVVLSIIALIMGFVGPRVLSYLSDSKIKAAKIQISNLSAAIDLYYLDTGKYPTANEGLNALVSKPPADDLWNGPYLKATKLPKDPWGNDYRYRPSSENGAYTIVSLGPDRQEGGDDIKNAK